MSDGRLHESESPTDESVVRGLLRAQSPQWSALPLRRLTTSGTEHHTWRLGDELLVRLPRDSDAEAGLRKEVAWWPRLAGSLPVAVPTVRHLGGPGEGYPHAWEVADWVPGEDLAGPVLAGNHRASWARVLAEVVDAIQAFDLTTLPRDAWPRGTRGGSFAERVDGLGEVLLNLAGRVDLRGVRRVLDAAAEVPTDPRVVLLHADLVPGNLVARAGEITGLLDLGCLTTGQPTWELTPAWWVLDGRGRAELRERLGATDADWALGRGFAMVQALMATWYYTPRGHQLGALGERALAEALASH